MRTKRPPLMPKFEPGDRPDHRVKGWTVTRMDRIGPLQYADAPTLWCLYASATLQKPGTTSHKHQLHFASHVLHKDTKKPDAATTEVLFRSAEEDLLESFRGAGCILPAEPSNARI